MSLWSSSGTLLVLQRDIGVMSSLLGVTVVLQRGIDVTVVLQGDIVGPPEGLWVSVWSSNGTLMVLQRDVGCHRGPPRGHCRSSKETLLVLQRDNVGCQCGPPKPPPPPQPPNKDVNVGRFPRLLLWGNLGGIRCFLGLHPTHLGVQTTHFGGSGPIDLGFRPMDLGVLLPYLEVQTP